MSLSDQLCSLSSAGGTVARSWFRRDSLSLRSTPWRNLPCVFSSRAGDQRAQGICLQIRIYELAKRTGNSSRLMGGERQSRTIRFK